MNQAHLQIKRGDTITVSTAGGTRSGIVKTAMNYGRGDKPCWYIEFDDPHNGTVYWKQDLDGGNIANHVAA
jgi:hypothetical protein